MTDVTLRMLPWILMVMAGGVIFYLNGIDPTGSTFLVAGMLGVATVTIRARWAGAMSRLGTRLGDLRRRIQHR